MSGRSAKIHPNVISVTCGGSQLTDKSAEYPDSLWSREEGRFDELINDGFLVEVKNKKPALAKPALA